MLLVSLVFSIVAYISSEMPIKSSIFEIRGKKPKVEDISFLALLRVQQNVLNNGIHIHTAKFLLSSFLHKRCFLI